MTIEAVESINANVEIYTYSNESSLTKFVHYKVYGGNHEWFGSTWAVNWGFNTSEELINFFRRPAELIDDWKDSLLGRPVVLTWFLTWF